MSDALEPWHDFFIATAGVVAALAGLLFVSVSINLARVLELPQLPVRALEVLVQFGFVLVTACVVLTPSQPAWLAGAELAAAATATWLALAYGLFATRQFRAHPRYMLRVISNQVPPIPFVIAGVTLAAGHPVGLYALLPGTVLAIASGLLGAWTLLVEIQR